MYTMEDLKTNRDAQITVGSIVFFLLAFPIYFGFAAGNADGSLSGSVVADYKVNGELTYIELDSGTEYVADGTPWMDTFNTDAVDDADEMNIVGLRVSLSYGEDDETGGDGLLCQGGQDAADTITGTATHLNFTETGEGQNGGAGGSHEVSAEWYNSSMVGGEVIEGLSMDDIKAQIDSMGAGLGDHAVEISVSAQAGNEPIPACSRSDEGQEVSYVVELIVFDYTIVPVVEVQVD
jgi:hypothetical protein